jgi:hypothetical protein
MVASQCPERYFLAHHQVAILEKQLSEVTPDVFCYYLTWKILTLHERVSRHHLRFYRISAQSDFKYGHQVAILEKQLSAVTPELMPGSSPNFNHSYI